MLFADSIKPKGKSIFFAPFLKNERRQLVTNNLPTSAFFSPRISAGIIMINIQPQTGVKESLFFYIQISSRLTRAFLSSCYGSSGSSNQGCRIWNQFWSFSSCSSIQSMKQSAISSLVILKNICEECRSFDFIIIIMATVLELEERLKNTMDEIQDIFHSIHLNIQALRVESKHKSGSTQLDKCLNQWQRYLKELEQLLNERSTLRLNYLITEQIRTEEGRVRRQRLSDYEQKIKDQRRLIEDKEYFYEALLQPKRKIPNHLSTDQYINCRKREISREQFQKFTLLKEEIVRLDEFYKDLRNQNQQLQDVLNGKEGDSQDQEKKKKNIYHGLLKVIEKIGQNREIFELLKVVHELDKDRKEIQGRYRGELEEERELRMEKQKMIKEYKWEVENLRKLKLELKGNWREEKQVSDRPVSR